MRRIGFTRHWLPGAPQRPLVRPLHNYAGFPHPQRTHPRQICEPTMSPQSLMASLKKTED